VEPLSEPKDFPPYTTVQQYFYPWLNRDRRLAKDFEASLESPLAWLLIANIKLVSRRLARS